MKYNKVSPRGAGNNHRTEWPEALYNLSGI